MMFPVAHAHSAHSRFRLVQFQKLLGPGARGKWKSKEKTATKGLCETTIQVHITKELFLLVIQDG